MWLQLEGSPLCLFPDKGHFRNKIRGNRLNRTYKVCLRQLLQGGAHAPLDLVVDLTSSSPSPPTQLQLQPASQPQPVSIPSSSQTQPGTCHFCCLVTVLETVTCCNVAVSCRGCLQTIIDSRDVCPFCNHSNLSNHVSMDMEIYYCNYIWTYFLGNIQYLVKRQIICHTYGI